MSTGLLVTVIAAVPLAVPFVPQKKDSCGAACLAMVSRYWNREISHEEIASRLLKPELRGIPGSTLMAFARELGLQAITYRGDLAQLRDFVGKGRPLIVAWRLSRDRYHNVVVVGFDERGNEVIVNDPAVGAARRISARTFEKRWAGAGYWTLLVMPPSS